MQRIHTFEIPKILWYSNGIWNLAKMHIFSKTVEKP